MGVISVIFDGMGVPVDRDLLKTNRAQDIYKNPLIRP